MPDSVDERSNARERGRRSLGGPMLLLAAVAVLVAGSVSAQPPDAPVYRMRAGDALSITVAGHEEWDLQVSVRPDGRITYPATGEIEVAGLTVEELTRIVTRALGPEGRHLRDPRVFINITGMRSLVAHVLGAVQKPGAVELPRGVSRLGAVLAMAGGVGPSGDLTQVTLYRGDGTSATVDLDAELAADGEHTLVRAGDVLVVPEIVVRFVGVLGAASQTGQVPLPQGQESIDMLDLLVRVGGVSESADRNRALIIREDGEVESVALAGVLTGEIDAPLLHGGDALWVPPAPDEKYFAITGAVASPGRYECPEGMTLADALALAGQLSEAADAERVMLIHPDGEKETLNIRPMLQGQETEIARRPIQPDDIVLVPSRDESYVVLGAVGSPGFFLWDEDTRLADALATAGGPNEGVAAMGRVVLVRRVAGSGNPTVLHLDARKLLQGQNEEANWKLMPGDAVYVPAKGEKTWLDNLSNPLAIIGILGSLANIFNW